MLGGLAFVFRVAIYFLILANLNRRPHPVMVSGSWDFSEVLLACSGFLIFGGPCMLTGINQRWRDYWLHGNSVGLRSAANDFWIFWISVWVVYYLLVLGIAIYLLWRRRLTTAIYNIERHDLEDSLAQTFDRLGLDWMKADRRYFIGFRSALVGTTKSLPYPVPMETAVTATPAKAPEDCPKIVLEVETFPPLRHATLHWSGEVEERRDEIELELARHLADVRPEPSMLAIVMITLAVILFVVVVVALAGMFILARHH
jgi:hypothetical protein